MNDDEQIYHERGTEQTLNMMTNGTRYCKKRRVRVRFIQKAYTEWVGRLRTRHRVARHNDLWRDRKEWQSTLYNNKTDLAKEGLKINEFTPKIKAIQKLQIWCENKPAALLQSSMHEEVPFHQARKDASTVKNGHGAHRHGHAMLK